MLKRLVPIMAMLSLGLWLGCGGDDDTGTNGNGGTSTPRLEANTSVSEPTLSSPDEAVWNSVDSLIVSVSGGNAPKRHPSTVAAIPDEVMVKAIKKGDKLYLRLQWMDATFDAYPDHYEVTSINTGAVPPFVSFERKTHELTLEDQVFVLFDGLPSGGYDVWNWCVLTTGAGGIGRGLTYAQTLGADAVGTVNDSAIAEENASVGNLPTYAHRDTSEFENYILYADDAIHYFNDTLGTIIDTFAEPDDTIPIFFYNTLGWDSGQIVPGWLIDSSFASLSDAQRGSRWDITSVSDYDSVQDEYSLVMCRKLNTGFTDDIDLSAVDSVLVKVGIYDAQENFDVPSNRRGYSDEFWIVLP